jgi:cyclopropane-fatty-acyl-phospholipid synthase
MARATVAAALAQVVAAPVRVRAYDGSVAGPPDAPVEITIRSRRAVAHLVSGPGELGFARAYVSGELDLSTGDGPVDHIRVLRLLAREKIGALTWAERLRVLRALGPQALQWVEPPPEEVAAPRLRRLQSGLRAHTPGRDAVAIRHHYDVSNRFYSWLLGPTMAYTCAVYPSEDATLEQAQTEKFDLVCRKLGLRPGQRLLDVGCGWGGLALHAARHHGVDVVAVTLSRQQAEWAAKAAAEAGLGDQVDVRHADYRDVPETGFDAVASIGLTEHIGIAQLPAYTRRLAARLRPQGRLLNHCITRPNEDVPPIAKRGFIARYVFPDGEIPGVARVVTELQRAGLEIRHVEDLREHYARTLAAWSSRMDARWDDAVAEVGESTARVWALYLAGSRLGFEQNRIQLHQVLAVRTVDGEAGMPLRPDWGS